MTNLPPVEAFCKKLQGWIEVRVASIPGCAVCNREDIRQEMYLQLVLTYNRMLTRDDVQTVEAVEHFIKEDMIFRVKNLLAQNLRPFSYKTAHNWLHADDDSLVTSNIPSGDRGQLSLLDERLNLQFDIETLITRHDRDGMMRLYYNGYSVPRIAKILGINEDQAYYKFKRLRERFQEVFIRHGIFPNVRYPKKAKHHEC
jgi:hypothetical protein